MSSVFWNCGGQWGDRFSLSCMFQNSSQGICFPYRSWHNSTCQLPMQALFFQTHSSTLTPGIASLMQQQCAMDHGWPVVSELRAQATGEHAQGESEQTRGISAVGQLQNNALCLCLSMQQLKTSRRDWNQLLAAAGKNTDTGHNSVIVPPHWSPCCPGPPVCPGPWPQPSNWHFYWIAWSDAATTSKGSFTWTYTYA